MEKQAYIIIITLLFSIGVIIATQQMANGLTLELISFFYFFGFFYYIYFRLKDTTMFAYLALLYFILMLFTSFLQKDILAITCSTFFFYTLLCILISKIFDHFYNEK